MQRYGYPVVALMLVDIVIGLQLTELWKCEKMIRVHTSYHGVQKGVTMHQVTMQLKARWREKDWYASIVGDRQPCFGLWKLNKYIENNYECFVQRVLESISTVVKYGAPEYTAERVSRAVMKDSMHESTIRTKAVEMFVTEKVMHRGRPSYGNASAV